MNVSASKVTDLLKCSYSFYAKNVLQLPDKSHIKTHWGSLTHDIIECILKEKRFNLRLKVIVHGFSFDMVPQARRLCRQYVEHHKLGVECPYGDIERMVALAFSSIRNCIMSTISGCKWASEERFEFKVGRANCSGYIDFLYVSPTEQGAIYDYKTKGQRFTKNELLNSIQAAIYQLYYHQVYGKLVPVHFVMLRFPPTSRNPSYHIQTVNAPSEAQLEGLRIYIDSLHEVINNFGIEHAHSWFCEDDFFCDRVCQFKKSFKYNALINISDNSLVGNYFVENTPTPSDEQYIEGREFRGCPKYGGGR